MNLQEKQERIQRKAAPHIARAFEDMAEGGIRPSDAAQCFILYGIGMLAQTLGPAGVGHHLRDVAAAQNNWLLQLAEGLEQLDLPKSEKSGSV